MTRLFLLRFLLPLLVATWLPNASAQAITLGVLEENGANRHYAGEPHHRVLRAIFERKDAVWQPFPNNCRNRACLKTVTSSYPSKVRWTIAFDGKNVGQVTSSTPKDFGFYSDVGQQEIISGGQVPTIGARSLDFSGYIGAEVYRPLIANSQPYFKDPDTWKPFAASPELTRMLQQAFRKKFPKLCRLGTDGSTLQPLTYRNEDVKLVKSYASSAGWVVSRLHLEAVDCADVEAGFDIDDPWFVVNAKGPIAYLDSGMWLVDAGDYDNDGKSELVFSISRDNEGGYEIYYDDFKKHATFKFNYH